MENESNKAILKLYGDIIGGFRDIGCELRNLRSFTKTATLFGFVATCYIFITEKKNRKQAAELDKLSREVEELKNQKG